jgi:hypothetical protein
MTIAVTIPRSRFELPEARAMCSCCRTMSVPVECSMPVRRGGYTDYADHQLAETMSGYFRHLVPSRSKKGKRCKGMQVDLLCRRCAGYLHTLALQPVEGERSWQKLDRERLALRLAGYLGLPVPTCSKCQAPGTPCRDCGVVLCDDCGADHTLPECPPAFAEYVRDIGGMPQ